MRTYIQNGTIVSSGEVKEGMNILIENGIIVAVSDKDLQLEKGSVEIDARGQYICPGFIDIHFHGAMGKDTMDANLQSLQVLSQYCAEHGVTTFYPTTWSASPEDIIRAIDSVKIYRVQLQGAQVPGVHLEGPYLSLEYKGAQMQSVIRNPVPEEYQKWFDADCVKLITCAPEIPGGMEFAKAALKRGIRISIGHSGASYEQVIEATDLGMSQATHLFNGMGGLHHRKPGTVGGLLVDDRISAQIISDGVHVHPAVVNLIVKAKPASRVILITDSIRGAGLPDGDYDHKGQKFTVVDGIARTPEGGLSGSTLGMDGAIRNTMKYTGKPIVEIVPMATSNPAEEMGLSGTKGSIKEGYDADLVLVNRQFYVEKTIVNGEIVFSRS
jgi:N-acetylglucosamine-6-phosphate deacetylase